MLPNKELEPVAPTTTDRAKIVEYLDVPEIPPEIEHAEAVSTDQPALSQPITDDSGQPIVSPTNPPAVKIILPLSDEEINQALHQKLNFSIRWLAETIKRLLKMNSSKFIYRLPDKP